jgi:CRP/FNR family transcriptional regulator, cyclic AMP receptor protein
MPRRTTREFDAEAFLQRAVADYAPERVKNKQIIFSQGEPADAAFYIQNGRIRISAISTNGKEATLALMGAKDFVGEECVASSHTLRLTTATAISDGSMIRIQKSTMLSLLKTQHRFSQMFVAFLLSRNAGTRKLLPTSSSTPVKSALPAYFCSWPNMGKTAWLSRLYLR